jgi:hypothetical protein
VLLPSWICAVVSKMKTEISFALSKVFVPRLPILAEMPQSIDLFPIIG